MRSRIHPPTKNPTPEERQVSSNPVTVTIPKGTYHFYCDRGLVQEHFISNHDQDNPKSVGISFQNLKNVTFDSSGLKFV